MTWSMAQLFCDSWAPWNTRRYWSKANSCLWLILHHSVDCSSSCNGVISCRCCCCCCSVASLTICRCPGDVDISSSEYVWPRYDTTTSYTSTGKFISSPCCVFFVGWKPAGFHVTLGFRKINLPGITAANLNRSEPSLVDVHRSKGDNVIRKFSARSAQEAR